MTDSKLRQSLGGLGTLVPVLGGGRRVQLYVHHSLANGHSWSQSVYIPFKPRQCVVRQIVFSVDPEREAEVHLLRGISLDNSVLGMVHSINVPVESGVVVDLADKHVGPTLHFQLQTTSGAATTANTGTVSAILEFVE